MWFLLSWPCYPGDMCLELSSFGGHVSTVLKERGKWIHFDVSLLLGNKPKSYAYLPFSRGCEFHFSARTSAPFMSMTVSLIFSTFYSWILLDLVMPQSLPKNSDVFSWDRPATAGVCPRDPNSPPSLKVLTRKVHLAQHGAMGQFG